MKAPGGRGPAQTVVITGASAGLGRAIAHAFARQGARVGLIGRDPAALEDTAREVGQLGGTALALPLDVVDAAAVSGAATRVEAELGPIDIWVNNAMATIFAPFAEIEPDEFQRATDVTYLGTVWGTRAALRAMRPRRRGVIVQVGSALAYRSIPLQSPYCGAKHAIKGFTDALRSELLHDKAGIALTMVQMPALNTPQFDWATCRLPHPPQPVPPIFEPEVGAEAVVWAARHTPRELIVGGPSWQAIWANKFFPGLLDRYLAKAGYSGQMAPGTVPASRPANLWETVPAGHRTRGRFTDRATDHSEMLWLATRGRWMLGAASLFALGCAAALRRRR